MNLSFTPEEQAFAAEIRAWLAANLDVPPVFATLDDEVSWGRAWQARLAADRWVGIHWPEEFGGRGASPIEVAIYNMEYARARAPQPVNRVGVNNVGPTLLAFGTDEQKRRWLPRILDASELWCQLFSEPGAGSDLAALTTRAVRVDDGWLLTGQKVWTSYAQWSRWGICLARTDPDAPKHAGISYLVVDMEADGIEIRPLVQLTGEAEFNEVFLDEVFVPDDQLVGGLHQGWSVASTTLSHERGTIFAFKEQVVHEIFLDELFALARKLDRLDDVEISDALVQSFVELRVLRLHNWRTLSRLAQGVEPGPETSWIKLHWSDMSQALSARAIELCGAAAPLWRGARDVPDDGKWQRQWLWSKAASIAGGTSEIQRNIIAERILGLPREGQREAEGVGRAVRVVGFDHLVLDVADVDRSLAFYCDELGCTPERVDEWRAGTVLFPSVRIDSTTLIDLLASERTGTNVDHLCLVIEGEELAALAASGRFDVVNGPTDGLYGAQGLATSLYVRDPDGNVVELRSY